MNEIILLLSMAAGVPEAPPSTADLPRFPAAQQTEEVILWARKYRTELRMLARWESVPTTGDKEIGISLDPVDPEWWDWMLNDLDSAIEAWEQLGAAHGLGLMCMTRAEPMLDLYNRIGKDNYRWGRMPPIVRPARRMWAPWIR